MDATSVTATCTAVSGWAMTSTPDGDQRDGSHGACSHLASGCVVAIRQAPSSFPSTGHRAHKRGGRGGQDSAPAPIRTQPKVRRSPRKAASTALAAARLSGSWKPSSTKARAMA